MNVHKIPPRKPHVPYTGHPTTVHEPCGNDIFMITNRHETGARITLQTIWLNFRLS
jgi:hypothetical protein